MKLTGFDRLRFLLMRRFREDWPTLYPVRVRMVELEEDSFGETALVHGKHGPYLVVSIEKRESDATKWLTLIHELAHALDWGSDAQEDAKAERYPRGHGPSFGIQYAALFEWLVAAVPEPRVEPPEIEASEDAP